MTLSKKSLATSRQPSSSQADKFKETARKLGVDEDEAQFERNLRAVAGHKPEAPAVAHASDCAVHDAPAYQAGECTCGVATRRR